MWYKGIIHPILKTGKDPLLPLSHRGISLMSTVAKIFSAIINNRLTTFMESHGIYAEEQNGFRRLRSRLDHLYTLTTIIRNRKAHNQETFCAFIDFEKAFDSIHYPLLWFKLAACGIQGKILQMIQSMYSNLECCFRVNGRLTDWFRQTAGVRQGDTLAPTLLAIFVNDLVPEINNLRCGVPISDDNTVSILLYADNIVLISDSSDGLQNMLNTLHSWSKTWMLKVNNDESKIMHFRKCSQERTQLEFPYGDTTLDIVHMYRYLGLNLYEHMDFSESVKCLTTASSRALGAVTNKYYSTNGLDYTTYTKLYDAMVSPVMDYGCEIWAGKKRDSCDTVQHRAMRTFLRVGKCTPLPMMYGDMVWIPPEIRQKAAMVRYWIQLTRMPDTRLTRRVFDWDHGRARPGTWCHDIKQIFEACDLGGAYQEKSRDRGLIDKIKNELYQNDCKRRRDDMQYMSRMAIYRQLNETTTPNITGPACHVSMNLKRAQRSVISKLRSGTLPLAIETGRYRQTPVPQRLCKQCDLNAVEHEQHFLFQCPRYDTIRHNRMGELDDIDSCFRSDTSIRNLSLNILDCLKLRV